MTKQTGPIALRRTDALSSILLAVTAPVATWALIGDLSVPGVEGESLDHLVSAPRFGPGVSLAVGVGSAAVAASAGTWLVWSILRRRLDSRWWWVVLPALAADVVIGAGARVVTAGVIGANIGGGFAIVLGGPLTVGMVTYSVYRARRLLQPAPSV